MTRETFRRNLDQTRIPIFSTLEALGKEQVDAQNRPCEIAFEAAVLIGTRSFSLEKMHKVVFFETLHFLTRDDLDACQLASSFLRDTDERSAKTLPLRRILFAVLVSIFYARRPESSIKIVSLDD